MNFSFLFKLSSKDMFKREWKTVDFLFHCIFWEKQEILRAKGTFGLAWCRPGVGRGQVPTAWPVSAESAPSQIPCGFLEDAGRMPLRASRWRSPEHSSTSVWSLWTGIDHSSGACSCQFQCLPGWGHTGKPSLWQSRHRRLLTENLEENKGLYNTVMIHTLQCLERIRKKNLQHGGNWMLKPSQAKVKW